MKSIVTIFIALLSVHFAVAGDLSAISSPTAVGGKTGKITLSISGGFAPYTISWVGPSGYLSSKVNPDSLAAGTYCVTVTDQYCGVAETCVTVIENTNSIQEAITSRWNVYPNPFTSQINIDFGGTLSGNVKIFLIDALGKVIATNESNANQAIQIDVKSKLASGIYILKVLADNGEQYHYSLQSLAE